MDDNMHELTPRQRFCLEQRERFPFVIPQISEYDHPSWVKLGRGVHISSGVKFAAHGFGYEKIADEWLRIPHAGKVVIGDKVEIGENTVIVRATAVDGETIIGEGTKIDTLVHVAHNVKIGKNCLIISGTVIGGSVKIGDDCYLGIGCMIRNKVTIGNNVVVGMGAVVVKNIPDNCTVVGNPARILRI